MDEAHKELVKRLRGTFFAPHIEEAKALEAIFVSQLEAARALEALAGEVERLKEVCKYDALNAGAIAEIRSACKEIMGGNVSFVDDDFARCLFTLKTESDRLKAAITTHVAGCVACGGRGVVFLCPERDDTAEAVREDCEECVGLRKALGDAS